MKHKTQHIQSFGGEKTPAQLYQDRKVRQSAIRTDETYGVVNTRQWLADRDYEDAHKLLKPNTNLKVVHSLPTAARQRRGRGEGTRSSQNSGDGNSDSAEPDPERRQPLPIQLYDQATLANLLIISKKSVQNTFSKTPWLLPPAIRIPGARGPRWTPAAIAAWLSERPAHSISSTPAPAKTKGKVGRPRIAFAKQAGVQS